MNKPVGFTANFNYMMKNTPGGLLIFAVALFGGVGVLKAIWSEGRVKLSIFFGLWMIITVFGLVRTANNLLDKRKKQ